MLTEADVNKLVRPLTDKDPLPYDSPIGAERRKLISRFSRVVLDEEELRFVDARMRGSPLAPRAFRRALAMELSTVLSFRSDHGQAQRDSSG